MQYSEHAWPVDRKLGYLRGMPITLDDPSLPSTLVQDGVLRLSSIGFVTDQLAGCTADTNSHESYWRLAAALRPDWCNHAKPGCVC